MFSPAVLNEKRWRQFWFLSIGCPPNEAWLRAEVVYLCLISIAICLRDNKPIHREAVLCIVDCFARVTFDDFLSH